MTSYNVKQVIVVRKDLQMRKGKMCAQVAHASMKWLLDNNDSDKVGELHVKMSDVEKEWTSEKFAKIVVSCDSEGELRDLIMQATLAGIDAYPIIDAGLTEFHGVPTLTCCAFGPDRSEVLDSITRHLKLL
jgi:PTH2 family peptidyl-tRNA hydrolase